MYEDPHHLTLWGRFAGAARACDKKSFCLPWRRCLVVSSHPPIEESAAMDREILSRYGLVALKESYCLPGRNVSPGRRGDWSYGS
jgi:hypothetical protein